MTEEWVDHTYSKLKDEEACHVFTIKVQSATENKYNELLLKLFEAERGKNSAKAALARAEKQVEEQCFQLWKAEEKLALAHVRIYMFHMLRTYVIILCNWLIL